jgi:hypothetical protein
MIRALRRFAAALLVLTLAAHPAVAQSTASIWQNTPSVGANAGDSDSYELGVKFRSSQDGLVTALRFYQYPENSGPHVGHLWDFSGNLLGSATFTGGTTPGWQEVALDPPVPVAANTVYVASYSTETGNYAFTGNYFTSQGVDNGPLRALSSAEIPTTGPNGVFSETPGSFPNLSYNNSNYWVDLVFLSGDGTPPTVTGQAPANGAPAVATNATVTVTFSEGLDPTTVSGATFELRDAGNALVPGSVTYSSGAQTATLTPSALLAPLATYTALVRGGATDPRIKDQSGNALAANLSWSFTTAAAVACPCTVFTSSQAPAVPQANDGPPIELGMKFRADVDGVITALRYYKATGATTAPGHSWGRRPSPTRPPPAGRKLHSRRRSL